MTIMTHEKAPGGLSAAQELAYLEGWAASVPQATQMDEARRSERRRATQARLLDALTAAVDPKLKAKVAAAQRQIDLCRHQIAVGEHEIRVMRQQLPVHLDDMPQHRRKIEERESELPLLEQRLPELIGAHRAAVAAVWSAIAPGYHRATADARARLELARQATKALIAEAEAGIRTIELLQLDIDRWIGE
jgi:hypothetical protein